MRDSCYNLEDIHVFYRDGRFNTCIKCDGWLAFTSLFISIILIIAYTKTAPFVFQKSGKRE